MNAQGREGLLRSMHREREGFLGCDVPMNAQGREGLLRSMHSREGGVPGV